MERGRLVIAFIVLSLVTVGFTSQNAFAGAIIPDPTLYGIAFHGPDGLSQLYTIDASTGVGTPIGEGIGFERCSAMDFDPLTGILYALCERADDSNLSVLITIDTSTGVGAEVGLTFAEGFDFFFGAMTDMSFRNSDNVLYAHAFDRIVTINIITGVATDLSDSGFICVIDEILGEVLCAGNALAFSPLDTLYHAASNELRTIDQTTGGFTDSVINVDVNRVNGMDYDPVSGVLYGIENQGLGGSAGDRFLVTIDASAFSFPTSVSTVDGLDAIAVAPIAVGPTCDEGFVFDPETQECILIPEPGTMLTKSPNVDFINPGETITYTFFELNTGNVALNPPTVTDDNCSPVTPVESEGINVGDTNLNGFLDPEETWEYTCKYTPQDCEVNPILNTATSSTTEAGSGDSVPDETSTEVSVACLVPETELTKSADVPFVILGETITYTFFESNMGNVDLQAPVITDPICSSPPVLVGGDVNSDVILNVGETWEYTCQYTPVDCEVNPILNTAISNTIAVPPFEEKFIPEETSNTVSVACLLPEGAYVSGSTFGSANLEAGAIGLANLDSGDITQIGPQVVTEGGLSGLTFDSNGDLFGSSDFGPFSQSGMYQINPITGESFFKGGIGIESDGIIPLNIRDLATQPGTDVIFGVGSVSEGGGPFGCPNDFNSLFTIDAADASADCVGTFEGVPEGSIGGIAFAPDGTLWATGIGSFDCDDEDCQFGNFLASFNPDASSTGFFLRLDNFLDGLGIRQSDGAFFGTTGGGDSVHSIDLVEGGTPIVAGEGDSPADITFFPFSAPAQPQTIATGGGSEYEGPTLGKLNNGRLILSNGFCFDQFCLDVLDYFNHLPIRQVDSGSTHTISMTAYCPSGSNRCNYASVGAAPPGTDINSVDWNVVLQRTGNSNDWQVIKDDPNGMLGDVTGTVQVVDASRIQYTFNIQFISPASIGTVDGNAEPPEDNLILVTEIRDNNGGAKRNIFNEGVFVNDIYAYPQVDTSYMSPLKVEPLCLNEDSSDRNTCAFEQVRQWTIKQAEEKLKEIYEQNNYKKD